MANRKTLTPNQILVKRAGTTTQHMVARILATYDKATERDIELGADWYGDAGNIATELGTLFDSREHAATVIAHYSPRTNWSRNIAAARHLATKGDRMTGALHANHAAAMGGMVSQNPLATLNGPKVASFARNILGDTNAVTVDVWAARVALGGKDRQDLILKRVGVYDAIVRAYRIAASQRGVTPSAMQATAWVVARGAAH